MRRLRVHLPRRRSRPGLIPRNEVRLPARRIFHIRLLSEENGKRKTGNHIGFRPRTPLGTRTLDTLIKSQVLYQLS